MLCIPKQNSFDCSALEGAAFRPEQYTASSEPVSAFLQKNISVVSVYDRERDGRANQEAILQLKQSVHKPRGSLEPTWSSFPLANRAERECRRPLEGRYRRRQRHNITIGWSQGKLGATEPGGGIREHVDSHVTLQLSSSEIWTGTTFTNFGPRFDSSHALNAGKALW